MNDALEYLAYIGSLILANPQVKQWEIIREEAQGNLGLLRYRLVLQNNDMVEMFERFEIRNHQVNVTKYSFHWQEPNGQLIRRWDNAAHYPKISTHPNHLHEGDENNVLASAAVSTINILELIR